ncbi:hypothetical protein Patl1_20996 [Pistacia atlantica]|uniref:Uncharacterized protein n=1 Tax=Pistacia atlantica TaxID=434234 RepID=A0ACC1BI19_9ROSI|nr:hypothetical protein Patl1_20996 [Pistacia atlantica]
MLYLIPLQLLLFTLTRTATSHYNNNFSSSSPSASSPQSEWRPARATYYAASDPRDVVGGACGYGDLVKAGYGKATVGLSESMFERGQICGACFELRCVEDLRWCIPGTSIIATVTNFCAPNYGFNADGGGHCNPPNKHFVLPIEAFEKIAIWKAGNMPVQYRSVARACEVGLLLFLGAITLFTFRHIEAWTLGSWLMGWNKHKNPKCWFTVPRRISRIKCRKEGGIRFSIDGSGIFISVMISNVAGAGDVVAVKIKGHLTGWLTMGRNWGQNWHINADLKNQPLSFEVYDVVGFSLMWGSKILNCKWWKCGGLKEAPDRKEKNGADELSILEGRKLFDEMPERHIVTWNSMIARYVSQKKSREAIGLYKMMIFEGVFPDEYTFSSIFKAFSELGSLRDGQRAHGLSVVLGVEVSNVFVGSALVDMYSKFGKMRDAKLVADQVVEKDVVLFTALIVGYSQQRADCEALSVFVMVG